MNENRILTKFFSYGLILCIVINGIIKAKSKIYESKEITNEDIYNKLGAIEDRIEHGSIVQVVLFLFAIGLALVILGLTYWPGLLEKLGIDTTEFYARNPITLIILGMIPVFYAIYLARRMKKRSKKREEDENGN